MTYTVPETWEIYGQKWEVYPTCPHDEVHQIGDHTGNVVLRWCVDCGAHVGDPPDPEHKHYWKRLYIGGRGVVNICLKCAVVIPG